MPTRTRLPSLPTGRSKKSIKPSGTSPGEVIRVGPHLPKTSKNLESASPAMLMALQASVGNRGLLAAITDPPRAPSAIQRDGETEDASAPEGIPDLGEAFESESDKIVKAVPDGAVLEPSALFTAFSWLATQSTSAIISGIDTAAYYAGQFHSWMLGKIMSALAARGVDMKGITKESLAANLTRTGGFVLGMIDSLPVAGLAVDKNGKRVEIGSGTLSGLHFSFSIQDMLSAGFKIDVIDLKNVVITDASKPEDRVEMGVTIKDLAVDVGTNIPHVLMSGLADYMAQVDAEGGPEETIVTLSAATERMKSFMTAQAESTVGAKIGSLETHVLAVAGGKKSGIKGDLSAKDLSFAASQTGALPGKRAVDKVAVSGTFSAKNVMGGVLNDTPFMESGEATFTLKPDKSGAATASLILKKNGLLKVATEFVEGRMDKFKAKTAISAMVKKTHQVEITVPIEDGVLLLANSVFGSSNSKLTKWAIKKYGIKKLPAVDINALVKAKLDAKLTAKPKPEPAPSAAD